LTRPTRTSSSSRSIAVLVRYSQHITAVHPLRKEIQIPPPMIAAELNSQHIDAVGLENQIPVWWSGPRLYAYLTRTWKRLDQRVWPVVFVRN
jgi:hypothetical protein